MRVYACDKGTVFVNGVDIRHLDIQNLRRLIGVVQQEPVLFSATVTENIRLGDMEITKEMIQKACRIANAEEFINRLEKVSTW